MAVRRHCDLLERKTFHWGQLTAERFSPLIIVARSGVGTLGHGAGEVAGSPGSTGQQEDTEPLGPSLARWNPLPVTYFDKATPPKPHQVGTLPDDQAF